MVSQRQVRVPSYTRTVPLITVEFVCQRCQRPQVVLDLFPRRSQTTGSRPQTPTAYSTQADA